MDMDVYRSYSQTRPLLPQERVEDLKQIHPPNTYGGKNSVKLRLYIMEGQERSLRLPAWRGRITLLLILFDRSPCVLTHLQIGANYEKDRKFLKADRRFGSLRNLSGHSF
jgi:hypothetical protein